MFEGREAQNIFHHIGGMNFESVFAIALFGELVPHFPSSFPLLELYERVSRRLCSMADGRSP
ncbi:hypothetical protein [Candidatus Entotheonella palauensis]|uniref:hypothetical protein n=1 Tax=Candidatus Entotheonella palauensis TaxID=93172 RepID=UPI001178B5E0|nr:hypothetical protein [Candidatus Entotheonella palauensis]